MDSGRDPYFLARGNMVTTEQPTTGLDSQTPLALASMRYERVDEFDGRAHVLIMAGGDGARLRPVTRALAGDDRPKQFCALVGRDPMLVQTERRAAKIAPPENTLILLTRRHEAYYRDLVSSINPASLVVQPGNRGTATAVLYGLLRIASRTPDAPVVILPSDHWFSDEPAFLLHVRAALGVVQAHENVVVLIGTPPTRPEQDYGWIEPSEPIMGAWSDLHRVARFVEKPGAETALQLYRGSSLWNTSVVVGQLEELLFLFALAQPDLVDAFLGIWTALGSPSERDAVEDLYGVLPHSDFSGDVLARHPKALAVLALRGVLWEDLGSPARIREARRLDYSSAAGRGLSAAG
jgi:mannose-1-phosphate guanylyltransferase